VNEKKLNQAREVRDVINSENHNLIDEDSDKKKKERIRRLVALPIIADSDSA